LENEPSEEIPDLTERISDYNADIAAERERFNKIDTVEFNASLSESHNLLGREVSDIVLASAKNMLGEEFSNPEELLSRLERITDQLDYIRDGFINNGEKPAWLRDSVNKYMECLYSWTAGTGLDKLKNDVLEKLPEVKRGIYAQHIGLYLAFLLQDETVGCQTGIHLTEDGRCFVWHTEEDVEDAPGERFDKLRVFFVDGAEFPDGQRRGAFIYPELLPGSAFCFSEDMLLCTDSLSGADENPEVSIPANMITWVMWHLGSERETSEILDNLLPTSTGYKLNIVKRTPAGIDTDVVDFVHNSTNQLKVIPGGTVVSSNRMTNDSFAEAATGTSEGVDKLWHDIYLSREERATRLSGGLFAKKFGDLEGPGSYKMFRMLCTGTGNAGEEEMGAAFCNKDVKASMVASIDSGKIEIDVFPGPSDKADWDNGRRAHFEPGEKLQG